MTHRQEFTIIRRVSAVEAVAGIAFIAQEPAFWFGWALLGLGFIGAAILPSPFTWGVMQAEERKQLGDGS